MADETSNPEPDATLTLSAERLSGMWTLYLVNGAQKTSLGAGTPGSGIMFPVMQLERAVDNADA
jgi:hypothetical protein